jgi:putative transposase
LDRRIANPTIRLRDYKSRRAGNPQESRKDWLLKVRSIEGRIWFWEKGYHGEEVFSKEFFLSKAEYIHYNPVKAGIVAKPEDYLNSSAARFYGVESRGFELCYFR